MTVKKNGIVANMEVMHRLAEATGRPESLRLAHQIADLLMHVFPAAKHIPIVRRPKRDDGKLRGLFSGLQFVEPTPCRTPKKCLAAYKGAQWISGNADELPIVVEIPTGEFIGDEQLMKRVEMYEDNFSLRVMGHPIDLRVLEIDYNMPHTQHDAIYRIVHSLRMCCGVLEPPTSSRYLKLVEYKKRGVNWHSKSCNFFAAYSQRENSCLRCRHTLIRERVRTREESGKDRIYPICDSIVKCLKEESTYVSGDMKNFPVQCCILDVGQKMSGRYITKTVSFFPDHFTLSLDGIPVDLERCYVNNSIGVRQHHLILAIVKSLNVCQGVCGGDGSAVEREHQVGEEAAQMKLHALDCNIIIGERSRLDHCDSCHKLVDCMEKKAVKSSKLNDSKCEAGLCGL